jgi:hypothetical protein
MPVEEDQRPVAGVGAAGACASAARGVTADATLAAVAPRNARRPMS